MNDQTVTSAGVQSTAEEPVVASAETPPVRFSGGWPPTTNLLQSNGLPEQLPVPWREPLAVVLLVVVFDLTIYRSFGYSGPAAWLVLAPALLALGVPAFRPRISVGLLGVLLLLLAARTIWQGSLAGVALGFAMLVAFTLALSGRRPYVEDVAIHFFQTAISGPLGVIHYLMTLKEQDRPRRSPARMLSVLLPMIAVAIFGTIFVMANPDLVSGISEFVSSYVQWLAASLENFVPRGEEVTLWGLVALITIGLLRPVIAKPLPESSPTESDSRPEQPAESSLYAVCRNTLIALIGLFAIYLIFEFRTLWFREFPEGFYYAGYAHEGAAWLTVALALATLVLSLIFRGPVRHDSRIRRLRTLAWIWSALNLVLAAAVYHRMHIYIDFNGMTRMRTIGLLGISSVVVGFLLVICMILWQRTFPWLVQRQLWTLAFFVYLYLLLPVDTLIHRYNVHRVMADDLAPVVQITEHPVSSEGVLMLAPLLESDDPIIREGIRAMLAERFEELNTLAAERHAQDWTAYQHADQMLLDELDQIRARWEVYADESLRERALKRLRDYAYQWY